MGYHLEQWLFFFFLFTMIGWIQESTIESVYHRKFINRGLLKGPYIPIYGVGGCAMLFFCLPFKDNALLVFISGLISCTILEYFTGFLMEKLFKKQFWDYSMLRFNYKNRISLVSSLFWGILSLFLIYILLGFMDGILHSLNNNFIILFDVIMMIAMAVDLIFAVKRHLDFAEIAKKLSREQLIALLNEKRLTIGSIVEKRRIWIFTRAKSFISYVDFRHDDDGDNENFEDNKR